MIMCNIERKVEPGSESQNLIEGKARAGEKGERTRKYVSILKQIAMPPSVKL